MSKVTVRTKCPNCGETLQCTAEVDNVAAAPETRSKIQPIGTVSVYRISTEAIKAFITEKAKQYSPGVKLEVVPRYCEKKRRNEKEPRHSYASLRIAFSEDIVEQKNDEGWFGKIGESGDNLRFQQSIFENLIKKYEYNQKDLEAWLKSYKNLEALEEALGMTEDFINDIKAYAKPQRITTQNNEKWIVFSAAAENVIADMLTDVNTGEVPGRIEIQQVYPLTKDIVEFIVYLHPSEMKYRDNPHVRQILIGEEKPAKKN